MSYLDPVRLVFSGCFQADVSTVNNDVRHYDNATFKPQFQEYATDDAANGRWNPNGTGAFRLIDCVVQAVHHDDVTATQPEDDPVVGMVIADSADRPAAKLIDLDPQWQMAAAPFGLEIRLTDGRTEAFFKGRYTPHACREPWIMRRKETERDGGSSAIFQSVLEGVEWPTPGIDSPFLAALRRTTVDGRLSIRLTAFDYQSNRLDDAFTLGRVVGVIGPYFDNEPESFILGRRFAPAGGHDRSGVGIVHFSGHVLTRAEGPILLLDLSNALPLAESGGVLTDLGRLTVGYLTRRDLEEGIQADPENFVTLDSIPYSEPGWLTRTGGVYAAPITADQAAALAALPLALVTHQATLPFPTINLGSGQVAIRETSGGLSVEAEPHVYRIDGGQSTHTTIFASRYGQPLPDQEVRIRALGRVANQNAPSPFPGAPIPDIGVPEAALKFKATGTTDACGRFTLEIETRPPGNPRKYIDGQIYVLEFRLPEQPNQARNQFDYIVLHVYDDFQPDSDDWSALEPIFTQYGNLYPIMSKGLFSFSDEATVRRHAAIIKKSMSLPIDDPNHMPASRDMSTPRRRAILRWLDRVIEASAEAPVAGGDEPGQAP